jgi:hypothetical protein
LGETTRQLEFLIEHDLPAQGGLRDVERFGRLPKTSGPGDFREGH